jgi:hypothetical protein
VALAAAAAVLVAGEIASVALRLFQQRLVVRNRQARAGPDIGL